MSLHHAVDILENFCWKMSPPINRSILPDATRAYGATDAGVHWKKKSRQDFVSFSTIANIFYELNKFKLGFPRASCEGFLTVSFSKNEPVLPQEMRL